MLAYQKVCLITLRNQNSVYQTYKLILVVSGHMHFYIWIFLQLLHGVSGNFPVNFCLYVLLSIMHFDSTGIISSMSRIQDYYFLLCEFLGCCIYCRWYSRCHQHGQAQDCCHPSFFLSHTFHTSFLAAVFSDVPAARFYL